MKEKQQFKEWIKLREESKDEYFQSLCYCGHTKKCTCLNPDFKMFKEAVKNETIILNDENNGWKETKMKLQAHGIPNIKAK